MPTRSSGYKECILLPFTALLLQMNTCRCMHVWQRKGSTLAMVGARSIMRHNGSPCPLGRQVCTIKTPGKYRRGFQWHTETPIQVSLRRFRSHARDLGPDSLSPPRARSKPGHQQQLPLTTSKNTTGTTLPLRAQCGTPCAVITCPLAASLRGNISPWSTCRGTR